MQSNIFKSRPIKSGLAASVLLLASGASFAQQQVNLAAGPATARLPDGSAVPMWGYSCGTAVAGSTATCGALSPLAMTPGVWSPVVITVPTGQDLQINLTNNLSFPTSSATPPTTPPNNIPTSLVIVGQLGAGLGSAATYKSSPTHAVQGVTWPIVGDTGGATFNPPAQGQRVQSFATEVASGATTSLTWIAPRPGTYLIESGTHPSIQGPMGLYGILVVTTAPSVTTAGTAYPAVGTTPAVTYKAEIPLLLSEIDPVQNNAVDTAIRTTGFSETSARVLRDSVSSVTVDLTATGTPIAGSGYVLNEPVVITGGGFTVQATAHVSALVGPNTLGLSPTGIAAVTIDNPGQGYTSVPTTVTVTGPGSGASLTANLSLAGVMCSDGSTACYPPAVNYTPLYYLFNGVAFDKTNASNSLFPAVPGTSQIPVSGNVLVRLVNAGLRMHVPSIVGSLTGTTPVPGFSLIAEDGNPLPGIPRVQSEVFMAAGKTCDVMINAPPSTIGTVPPPALPIYDRELSLSANAVSRDGGMLAYISVNGGDLPTTIKVAAAIARADTYNSVIPCAAAPCKAVTVSDPAKGVIANDTNVYGVQVLTAPIRGALTLNADGTFLYTPNAGIACDATTKVCDTFVYKANGNPAINATVTLAAASIEAASGITVRDDSYPSNVATSLSIKSPGILANDSDAAGYPLTVSGATLSAPLQVPLTFLIGPGAPGTGTVIVDPNGGFNATVSVAGTYTFTYKAQNSQGTVSASAATVTLTFPAATGLAVTVKDGKSGAQITDYRWIIEEDRTFYVDPTKTTNVGGTNIVPTFGTNFHTSYMPVVAAGCTGPLACEGGQTVLGQPAVCDVGNGVCRPDPTSGNGQAPLDPKQVHLDPNKRYYISVLPGDAANPFNNANLSANCVNGVSATNPDPTCGHGMGGAPISFGQTAVTVRSQPTPFPPAKLTVFVFEDDFPLNGEHDSGGGIDVVAPNEPGLGGFNITLFDDAGGPGDATGQMTYDMFNQPLSNSLAGTIDPSTGMDACPISKIARSGANDPTQTGITGTIVTCPKYESDGKTLSPLAGQAIVANLMPGRYGVVATPGADRIARGEEWLQTNTLDGQKAHDSFLRIGEPAYFQEFGPSGYHVTIGFANPKIINDRKPSVCNGTNPDLTVTTRCTNSVTGLVTTNRMSRTPDQRLYGSGDNSSFGFTQCYVSFGDPDGIDFAFTKCDAKGTFTLSGLPDGVWRITVFDQWNDMLVDGLSTPVRLSGGTTTNLGQIAINQWQANIYTSTFFDQNGNGVRDSNESGLTLVATNNRFRDGSYSNFNNTDLNGMAGFNEIFPLFSWYVIETDTTRYKSTGTHVVYDSGGPADGNPACGANGFPPCGNSTIAGNMANTAEAIPLPANLRVPGAYYCGNADCTDAPVPLAPGANPSATSSGRVDPAWVATEGWQGFAGQNSFIEFGKMPFAAGETGGIHGEVIYASTRPFDDPSLLIHTSWTPDVPGVTINLYQEGTAPDGSQSLTLIDTTKTSSFDEWAQGFRSDGVPNMNCPGQGRDTGTNADLFFFSLYNQPQWLDLYNSQHGGSAVTPLPNNAQFKCYDGMHNWNQVQPAPYDGMYQFPSVRGLDRNTGKPTGTNCTACVTNPDSSDPYRYGGSPTPQPWVNGISTGTPMLPPGKYVVEVVVPPGYELVKEEDKNILIGDNYIAPVTVQFPNLASSIYILPDQAEVSALYNPNNPQNPTQTLGRTTLPSHEGDTGSVETFWPCVGAERIVPDYISLFPGSHEVAPFAGAKRRLCDRKEVQLVEQTAALAKFWIFSSTHVAAHFTGVITDDFTSEFDPFSPQFGEKFAPADLPVSIKDWTGNEISRVYADHWGSYNGLTYSTWEVNPPNPTGYAPTMMVTCMNDRGSGPTPDPLYNPAYSQFCYEIPFMPGQTQYMDTPVVPTSAFAGAGYNNPDCAYPDAVPGIKEVDGDGVGPWVSAAGHTLTITAIGDQTVTNYAYSGPSATTIPFNQKTVTRHYGFGTQCTAIGGACTAVSSVTIGGVAATITGWSDTSITVTAPGLTAAQSSCAIQQQVQYGGSTASCGELIITAGNGKTSVDTVTVTIGGKAPTHVTATNSIQAAIDAAAPGDLIIVDPIGSGANSTPAVHNEILLMWKPVRLQGVGAVSSIIDANTHPAGKLDPWRRTVNCLMGLGMNGWAIGAPLPTGGTNSFDPTGTYFCDRSGTPNGNPWNYFTPFDGKNPQVDRLPLEATVGWDANLNGNLAELLQEPSLMGALEGAGITVLSKGVNFPSNPFDPTLFAGFPTGTPLLTSADCGISTNPSSPDNPFPSNFQCNPSSIDGLTITNSSQGGGAIFVHGWGHNIQIANNRVRNNSGTLSGGINVGQGEYPPGYLQGSATNAPPGSCYGTSTFPGPSVLTNTQLPYCHNLNVNIHHNAVMLNSSTGDELFSATPAGAGGITFTTGSDKYKLQNNWVCGNLSVGDGGGIAQLGFAWNGDIEHNTIIFNQSTNPTISTNGGGILIYGAPDVDPPCSGVTDADCLSPANTVPPSDGTGPGLVINANLIMGNAAESGSGGGLRLHNINGTEVINFPQLPSRWYAPLITNNIIVNNVAGWDGAGISLHDALAVNIINNTIMSNDTTASSGVLFNTLMAPLASSQGPCAGVRDSTGVCTVPWTSSVPQPAGLVSIQNSAILSANMPATVVCPQGHYFGTGVNDNINGTCRRYSTPLLYNNIFWQNRAFYIGVGSLGSGTQNQQNVVTLYDGFSTQRPVSQSITGQCPTDSNAYYWDIGVRGDTGRSNHSGGLLTPRYSILTDAADYPGLNNQGANPAVFSQYCNGARVPPENGGLGYNVPPGIADATVPNPIFSLTPAATVDEGNNWINITWGPLSLSNPSTLATLGNYAIPGNSPAVNTGTSTAQFGVSPPATDFFGNTRTPPHDIGAVEPVVTPVRSAAVTPAALAFGNWATGTTSTALTATVTNTGNQALAGGSFTIVGGAPFSRPTAGTTGGTCGTALAVGASCTYNVVFSPATGDSFSRTLTVAYTGASVTGTPVTLTGAGVNMAVTPASLTFPGQPVGTTSAPRTLTVQNSTGTPRSLAITGLAAPFSRPTGTAGGTCGATLNSAASCTINIVFTAPPSTGTFSGSVTITTDGGFTVANSPVNLTGFAVPVVISASLTPTSWSPQQTRNCPGTTVAQQFACSADPAQTFTLTNTGNMPLTGIGQGVLAGTNAADYGFRPLLSTCGRTITTLAPGATCTVLVQFQPLTSEPAGIKNATISVTDAAGTQTSTLAGQAQ